MADYCNTEFYITPKGEIMIHDHNGVRTYREEDKDFTDFFFEAIEERYPDAFAALSRLYAKSSPNILFFKYRLVHRFIRCNFNIYDKRFDIDEFGDFNFEEVSCPLRNECELNQIVCDPKFSTAMTVREHEVMRLLCVGLEPLQVAGRLGIQVSTVPTHKRNVFKKLGLHSMPEFMAYAAKNKIFDNE